MSCGLGYKHADPSLLWLWCSSAAAAAIRPLAWELPYAAGTDLKRQKKKEFCIQTLSNTKIFLTEITFNSE